jgi:hypothetical protein
MVSIRKARILIGLGLFFAWVSLLKIQRVDGTPYPFGLSQLIDLSFLTTRPALIIASLLFLGCISGFIIEKYERCTGFIMIVMLAIGEHIGLAQWEGSSGSNRALILPAMGTLAYLLQKIWSERKGLDKESATVQGVHAACGIIGAGYTLSAISKLRFSGLEWLSSTTLATHITIHSYNGEPWLRGIRLMVADNTLLCSFFALGTIILEGGGILFLLPRLRPILAVGISLMHISIALFTGLYHFDWMFIAVGFALYPISYTSKT